MSGEVRTGVSGNLLVNNLINKAVSIKSSALRGSFGFNIIAVIGGLVQVEDNVGK